jgi:O-antigen/teichoic acid export membrane protein
MATPPIELEELLPTTPAKTTTTTTTTSKPPSYVLRNPAEDYHRINVDLVYKLLSLLVLSVFIPGLVVMVLACMEKNLSHQELVWLLIFCMGCPFVAIMVVSCVVLWVFECEKMRGYEAVGFRV